MAEGKLGIYGIYLEPEGEDAEDYSRSGWGGGIHAVVPWPQVANVLAGTGGFEVVNLLTDTIEFRDNITGLRVEQRTSQNYFRIYVGAQAGGHGSGFIRPHAGANLALAIYHIGTDVVIPNDAHPDEEVSQDLYSDTETAFAYDFTIGLDLNFWNSVAIDGGVRYLRSMAVPQQLGGRSVKIYPEYFQAYFGVGMSFSRLRKH